jgi:excisionase family DNA binding protein
MQNEEYRVTGKISEGQLLRPTEVAEMLAVKLTTVYQWAYERRLKSIKLGGSLRFRQSDIEAFIKSGERPALRASRNSDCE